MSRLDLSSLVALDGFLGACVVDAQTGDVLGSAAAAIDGIDLDAAAKAHVRVMAAKRETAAGSETQDEVEDILVALESQYHVLRPLNDHRAFLYLALDRSRANLGMARLVTKEFEKNIAKALESV
ncbi:MAG: roadblock/LC7 domain-containing protein [Myxococcota bacterium]